ncbi:MAG: hypothetical protein ACRC33_12770 [Gemmataceae bacterium]
MSGRRLARTGLYLLALGAVAAGGCGETPRAPALRDDPVYQNEREGFRFLAPEGWRQRVRGEVQAGKVERERPLVEYRPTAASDGTAMLRVSLIDLAPSADVAAVVSAPSHSVEKWEPAGPPEEAAVGGAAGTRYAYTGRAGKGRLAKEVIAVRRGGRVYFFTALFDPKDADAREQLRRVVGSVIWKA